MPAIRLFHRRTILGGDDLQISSLFTIAARVFQLAFLLVPVVVHIGLDMRGVGVSTYLSQDPPYTNNDNDNDNDNGDCGDARWFVWLLLAHVTASTLYALGTATAVEWSLVKWSSVGTPTEPHLRHPHVEQLLELKLLPLAILHAWIFLLGVIAFSLSPQYYRCRNLDDQDDNNNNNNADDTVPYLVGPNAWWLAFCILLLSQAGEFLFSVVTLVQLFKVPKDMNLLASSAAGTMVAGRVPLPPPQHHALTEELWHNRCATFCRCLSISTCFLFGGRDIETGDYTDISRAMADYFETGGVLDLVPSDIAIGFVMLQRVQRQRILEARRRVLQERHEATTHDINTCTASVVPQSPLFTHDTSIPRTTSGSNLVRKKKASPAPNVELFHHSKNGNRLTHNNISTVPMVSPGNDVGSALLPPPDMTGDPLLLGSGTAVAFRVNHEGADGQRPVYEPKSRQVLSRTDESDRQVMAEGARFARPALAIYTWVLYIYMHPLTGGCRILGRGRGCCTFSSNDHHTDDCPNNEEERMDTERFSSRHERDMHIDPELGGRSVRDETAERMENRHTIIGDNCCQVHKSALLLHAGLEDSDLVYAQLKSSFTETPYCIILDHRWKTVVVAIRGTLSLEDCVTDVLLDPEPLDDLGREFGFDAEGEFCHSGTLGCARYIYCDLKRHGSLDRLLGGDNATYPDYMLRIVGHSLGAGTANILSFMLRPTFPSLRCLCYSPMGGFLTWKLVVASKEFCTSFVLDSDLVTRLSVDNMEFLRNEVLELLARIKVPKVEVARNVISTTHLFPRKRHGMGSLKSSPPMENMDVDLLVESNARLLHRRDAVPPDSDFALQLEQFKAIQRERRIRRGQTRSVVLYPPGLIVHLVKTGEDTSCHHQITKCITCWTSNVGSEYTPVWAENDDFNEIVVSPTMGTDHFPSRVCVEIENVANSFGLDTSLG